MNLQQFSNKYSIDEKVIKAVVSVESNGNGFNADGSLKIRFEAHLVIDKLPHLERWFTLGNPRYLEHFYRFPSTSNRWKTIHTGKSEDEYNALLTAAFQLGNQAFDFCSMGSFQIMGFHCYDLGFVNSIEQFTFASKSLENDIELGLRFLSINPKMVKALQSSDFHTFALLYNGSALVDEYTRRLTIALNAIGRA